MKEETLVISKPVSNVVGQGGLEAAESGKDGRNGQILENFKIIG